MTPMATSCARLAVLALAFALGACSPKVSEASYDRITEGMKEDQVQSILGVASESRSSAVKAEGAVFTSTQTRWRSDKGTIVVLFLNGEVQQKIFYAPGQEPPPERSR